MEVGADRRLSGKFYFILKVHFSHHKYTPYRKEMIIKSIASKIRYFNNNYYLLIKDWISSHK